MDHRGYYEVCAILVTRQLTYTENNFEKQDIFPDLSWNRRI